MSDGASHDETATRIKICGLREAAHARVALDAGADFLGIVFAPSARTATLAQARAIRAAVGPRVEVLDASAAVFDQARQRAGQPLLVGVFARQDPDEINEIAAAVDLDLIQLSGGEPPELIADCIRPVIRAVHIGADATTLGVRKLIAAAPGAVPLLDARSDQGGGTGVAFDWAIAAGLARDIPFFLAGGLTPENVAEAIARVHPWGVDVSSGVETGGRKDPAKIRAFIAATRNAIPTS